MILCPKIRFLKFISNCSFLVHQEAITKTRLPHVRKFCTFVQLVCRRRKTTIACRRALRTTYLSFTFFLTCFQTSNENYYGNYDRCHNCRRRGYEDVIKPPFGTNAFCTYFSALIIWNGTWSDVDFFQRYDANHDAFLKSKDFI